MLSFTSTATGKAHKTQYSYNSFVHESEIQIQIATHDLSLYSVQPWSCISHNH